MRFPTAGEDKKIDRPHARRMLELALDGGVNYFDTAVPYHAGESEEFVGEFFSDKSRESVMLATKMPVWKLDEAADLDRIFGEQLERLRTDYVDFYLLHGLNVERWARVQELGAIEWGERMKKEGGIRYFGFSFHDAHDAFVSIIDGYEDWDFCQVQYNYMNETIQAGTAGVEYAAQKGLGVVVMEPLLGGGLASVPEKVAAVFDGTDPVRPPVEHALRWLWSKPEVGILLSGMSSVDQVEQNLSIADRSPVGCVPSSELDLFRSAKEVFEELRPVACTSCRYCMPCPNGVFIPENFQILNDYAMFGNERSARFRYNKNMAAEHRASACTECGECEPTCPQEIPIIDMLKQVDATLVSSD